MLFIIAAVTILIGVGILQSVASQPVYTDAEAPARLSRELENLPREQRFKAWYEQLPQFETSTKRHADQGRGMIALGLGLAFCGGVVSWFHRLTNKGRLRLLIVCWIGLWAVRVPLSIWYYSVRQERFDYPVWGDSIVIGIVQDMVAWGIGLVVTSVVLALVMIGYSFRGRIVWLKPVGVLAWVRASWLWLWVVMLLVSVMQGVPNGNEGEVFSCVSAIPLLLLVLSAERKTVVLDEKEATCCSDSINLR